MPRSTQRSQREALHAFVTLVRASSSVTQRVHVHLGEEDLTVSQFAVLEAVLHLGPLRQCDLSQRILSSPGNLTTIIDNLERDGQVERRPDEEDRRAKRVHLTPAGRRRIQRVFPRHAKEVESAFTALTPTELNTLARLCRKLDRAQSSTDSDS